MIIFADRWHTTPFDVMEKDIDVFIMIANSLIDNHEDKSKTNTKEKKKTQERIRVNDKTATGGWF